MTFQNVSAAYVVQSPQGSPPRDLNTGNTRSGQANIQVTKWHRLPSGQCIVTSKNYGLDNVFSLTFTHPIKCANSISSAGRRMETTSSMTTKVAINNQCRLLVPPL